MGQSSRVLPFLRPVSALLLTISLPLSGGIISFSVPAAKAFGVNAVAGEEANCEIGFLVAVAGTSKKQLGRCPLKHTDVTAEVSGFVSRVIVKQQFHNPYKEKIEAVYTFPLPENAAVDEMTMRIGNRIIRGTIKKRDEAKQVYETAKAQGHVASLLDQERPNVFTQAVANIEPGQNVDIEIKYVNTLKYDSGAFTFSFPTVVGPRFNPSPISRQVASPIKQVKQELDSPIVNPTFAPIGERAGHDIAISLNINSGIPINAISSKLHRCDIIRRGTNQAQVSLKPADKIPNRDFVVTWDVSGEQVQSGFLAHGDENGGVFSLFLIPPKRVVPQSLTPKELVFLIDCSGSQFGEPIKKAKEALNYILDHLNPNDTFQIVSFNHNTKFFSPQPKLVSASMRERAHRFVDSLEAEGGTWMQNAVEDVCGLPNPENRLRIVTFMTDGYVGNDVEIVHTIKKFRGKSRWFSFGTGNSVNRFLIDKIAAEGGGEAEYVLLNSSAEEVGKKFFDRISSPVLTDIDVEFSGVEVNEVYPRNKADLWAQKPLSIMGRYLRPGTGKVVLTGYSGGKPYKQEMPISFAQKESSNNVIDSVWARAKVEQLLSEEWLGWHNGLYKNDLKQDIIDTALKYHIMTPFTSFVAVEEDRATAGGAAKKVTVPVEAPQGLLSPSQPSPAPVFRPPASTFSTHCNPIPAAITGRGVQPMTQPVPMSPGLPSTNMGKYVHTGTGLALPPGASLGFAIGSVAGASSLRKGSGGSAGSGDGAGGSVSSDKVKSYPPYKRDSAANNGSSDAPSGGSMISDDGANERSAVANAVAPNAGTQKRDARLRRMEIPAPGGKSLEKAAPFRSSVLSKNLLLLIERLEEQSFDSGSSSSSAKKRLAELIRIKINLNNKNSALMDTLRAMGFVLEKDNGFELVGRAKLSKLKFLTNLPDIVSIERYGK